MVLLVLILALFAAMGILGAVLKGLAWLLVVGLVGFCVTLAYLLVTRSRT